MSKEELKKEIADIEAGMKDLNAEEQEMVRKSLANAKKQLAEMEAKEKPAEPKKDEKPAAPKKEEPIEPKKEEPEKPPAKFKEGQKVKFMSVESEEGYKVGTIKEMKYFEKPSEITNETGWLYHIPEYGDIMLPEKSIVSFSVTEPKKDEKKEVIPVDTLTPSELQRVKEVYAVLKKANYMIVKRKGQPDKRMTRVKEHSQSFKHAKRIIDNVPVIFRPATLEIAKSEKKERNKELILEVEKMKDFLTIFMNDLDLIILTENEKSVKTINNWLIDLIKKAHENDFSFKYDGRAKIKDIAKKHRELSVVKFAGGGSIID